MFLGHLGCELLLNVHNANAYPTVGSNPQYAAIRVSLGSDCDCDCWVIALCRLVFNRTMVDRTLYNRTGQIALKTITIPQKSDIAY